MHRNTQDKDSKPRTKNVPKSKPGKPPADVKKASLEKAYGSSNPKPKQSSIVATSKASYATKYGATTKPEVPVPGSRNSKAETDIGNKRRTLDGNKKISPAANNKGKSVNVTPPVKQNSDNRNKSTEKSIAKKLPEPKKDEEENYDDDYGEDFEEDYQSDFEEVDDGIDDADAEGDVMEKKEVVDGGEEDNNDEEEEESSEEQEEEEVSLPARTTGFFRRTSITSSKSDEVGNQPMLVATDSANSISRNSATVEHSKLDEVPPDSGKSMSRQQPIFNFAGATKNREKEMKLKRSHQLMNMISLHAINSISVLHIDSNPEEMLFALSRKVRYDKETQVDKACEVQESQTDLVPKMHKWTQRPPNWSMARAQRSDVKILKEESLGVGSEKVSGFEVNDDGSGDSDAAPIDPRMIDQLRWEHEVGSSWNKIAKFISRSSRKILYVLESQKRLSMASGGSEASAAEVQLGRGPSVFNNLDMGVLSCSGDFVACANFYPIEKSLRKNEAKTVITLWSLKEPSSPKYYMRMWGKVTAICIFVYGHIVIAGEKNGGLAVWDLDESTEYHRMYQNQVVRTVNIDTSLLQDSHKDFVIGIKVVPEDESVSLILSMDRSGLLKLWSLTRSKSIVTKPNYPQNTAYWSKLDLIHKTTINLGEITMEKHLAVTDFMVWTDSANATLFAFGTMNGFAIKGAVLDKTSANTEDHDSNIGAHVSNGLTNGYNDDPNIKQNGTRSSEMPGLVKYEQHEGKSWITAIDCSIVLGLIMVGSADGKCSIYRLHDNVQLLKIDCGKPVRQVRFSRVRLSVLYVAFYDAIHAYELLKNTTTPWKTMTIQPGLEGLEIYSPGHSEFTIVLTAKELKAVMLCGELRPLSDKERPKLQAILSGA